MKLSIITRKIRTVIRNPKSILIKLLYYTSPLFSDRLYLELLFPLKTGYALNLENPETYNEKLQWLKIHYRKPIMTKMVDKYEAKKYTAELIGEEYVIESYGLWNTFDEIDFDQLPDQFVLKTTHDQGGVAICYDKTEFDIEAARRKINKCLKTKHYYLSREWPYKHVKPRIIAEKLLIDSSKDDLWDYKFYCFHGDPKVMYISMGRQSNKVPFYFFDNNFNSLNIERPGHISDGKTINKPKNWEKMIFLAKKASKGFPHVRVDFYNIEGKIYSGEYTFYQGGGMMPFSDKEWDYKFGSWIDLDKVNKT